MKTATRRSRTERAGRPVRRAPLTRERVLETALRVMDQDGLEAVTMRRIGRELGSAHRGGEPGEDRVGVRRDHHHPAVGRRIRVRRPTAGW